MNEFQKAKDILEGVRMAEKALQREMRSKCDWADPEDVNDYRRIKRRDKRRNIIPEGRRCPSCGSGPLLGPKQWVSNGVLICCRSCFQRIKPKDGVAAKVEDIFTPVVVYALDGRAMQQVRLDLGLTTREFARQAGWKTSYYSRLETEIRTVSPEVYETWIQTVVKLKVSLSQGGSIVSLQAQDGV